MTAPKSRARRRPCKVCGLRETEHADPFIQHDYAPIDPTPHGTHQTPRLDLKVPDPQGHGDAWREAAHREGVTLGVLVQRLLDQHVRG